MKDMPQVRAFRLRARSHFLESEEIPGSWRPYLRRNPIHTLKPLQEAIMQTFLSFLAIPELSPGVLIVVGVISLGFLAIFLRHKLG